MILITGGQHSDQIDQGVDFAQEHTGEGDTQREGDAPA